MEAEPVTAQGLNMTCFELSKQLDELEWSVADAKPLARRLLRIVGRIVIDAGEPGAAPATWPNTESMALQWLREALRPQGYDVTPLADRGRPPIADPSADWS